jgi:hypothetical protein
MIHDTALVGKSSGTGWKTQRDDDDDDDDVHKHPQSCFTLIYMVMKDI